jgi:hypothetical protein
LENDWEIGRILQRNPNLGIVSLDQRITYLKENPMSKKNLFISAAVTTFVLVILANVVTGYAKTQNTIPSQPDTQQSASTVVQSFPVDGQAVQLTHQEAANIAAKFLGQNDLYSVENTIWNGADAYKVVFSSGYIVYVSLDGQILESQAPTPVFVSVPGQNGNANPSQAVNGTHSGDDHDDDDHDDHDDD